MSRVFAGVIGFGVCLVVVFRSWVTGVGVGLRTGSGAWVGARDGA